MGTCDMWGGKKGSKAVPSCVCDLAVFNASLACAFECTTEIIHKAQPVCAHTFTYMYRCTCIERQHVHCHVHFWMFKNKPEKI